MGSQHSIGGKGGILSTFFKISIILSHWLSEIYKKEKKNEILCMWFQKTPICFNEFDYVTVHSAINIMTANGVKIE